MKLQMGATLQNGKYQLNQVLGHESLGATYQATQTLLQQTVVIKTIDPSLQITQSFPQLKLRFIEETRLLARCQHPSIVRVLDFFQEDGLPFLVMEHILGQTLHDRVSTPNAPALTEAEAVHYLRQVASALSVAHRNGLIHRNIRPETIVRRQGTNLGILVGFGLAHDVAVSNPIATNPFLPHDPNRSQDNRFAIDFYSLAATLYYLLTRQIPSGKISLEQYPWSPATKQAIFRGLSRDPQVQTVDDWLRLLPNTTLPLIAANNIVQTGLQNGKPTLPITASPANGRSTPVPIQNGHSPIPPNAVRIPVENPAPIAVPVAVPTVQAASVPTIQATPVQVERSSTVRRFPKYLMPTIAAAGAIGLGFGFVLRISAARSPEATLLQPVQPFAEKEWKGTIKPSSDNLLNAPIESNSPNAAKTPQEFVAPEVDRPFVPPIAPPEPEYRPIQPRSRRSPLSEPIVPTSPKFVEPDPLIEPTLPEPNPPRGSSVTPPTQPAVPPATAPAAPAPNPAPLKPSTREDAPLPPLNSTP